MKTSTKKVRRNVIVIAKRFDIQGTDGIQFRYRPGHILWRGKPNQKSWELTNEGFVIRHFYCYNQHEIIPFSHLKLQVIDEQQVVKRTVVETVSAQSLKF